MIISFYFYFHPFLFNPIKCSIEWIRSHVLFHCFGAQMTVEANFTRLLLEALTLELAWLHALLTLADSQNSLSNVIFALTFLASKRLLFADLPIKISQALCSFGCICGLGVVLGVKRILMQWFSGLNPYFGVPKIG